MIEIPLKIESTANLREHWAKKAKRAKAHREIGAYACQAMTGRKWQLEGTLPAVIKLTRIAPRELDGDNLQGGCKNLRDGIADWLGIKDNDPRVTWQYAQAKGKPKTYAVRIEFT